jgi:hypothetical protein
VVLVSVHPFLSDEWIEEAEALRRRYEHRVPPPPVPARLNVVVTEIPHREGDLQGHIDSSDGQVVIERGHLHDAELTVTIDYATARAVFVSRDQQAVVQAFFAGKILVEGDASKLLALQLTQPDEELSAEIHRQIQRFTADD